MSAVGIVVCVILGLFLPPIQGFEDGDVDGGWRDYMALGKCMLKRSTDSSMWPGWPSETWPPEGDAYVKRCFHTWQRTMIRSCSNPRPKGKGKMCEGKSSMEAPCACNKKVRTTDCESKNGNCYLPDPCSCSCFYHCVKVAGTWRVPAKPECCKPCTFWSDADGACVRVLEGCKAEEKNETTVTDEPPKYECTLRAAPDKHMFYNDAMLQKCSENTVFDAETCGCTFEFDPHTVRDLTCLSFDKNVKASHGRWVSTANVTIVDGGVHGSCAYFNGWASLSIPSFSGTYTNYKQFAISFYFKTDPSSDRSGGLLSNGDCGANDFNSIAVSTTGDTIRAGFRNGSNAVTEMVIQVGSSKEEWKHVAMSWDENTLTIYVNGHPEFVGPFKGPLAATACPLTLGVVRGPYGFEHFKGYIDEMCFYKTSLSRGEVEDIYAKPGYVFSSYYMPAGK